MPNNQVVVDIIHDYLKVLVNNVGKCDFEPELENIWKPMKKMIARIFLGLVVFVALTACDSNRSLIENIDLDANQDSDVAYDVVMVYTDNAVKVMELTADKLERQEKNPTKDIFPEGILVTFYNEGEIEYATLRADYAERLPDQYLVIATDNVVFENIEGEKLETSQLKWDERKGRIFTDRFAKFTRPDEIIYGYGFNANQDFTEIEFEKTTGKRPVPMLDHVAE